MNRYGSAVRQRGPIQITPERVRVSVSLLLLAWLGHKIAAVLGWFLRHPKMVPVIPAVWVSVSLARSAGPVVLAAGLAGVVVLLAGWQWRWPATFARFLGLPVRGLWRGRWVYAYAWQPAMQTTGLAINRTGTEHLPVIRRVRSTASVDQVRVRMLPGQVLDDWAKAAPRLAQTFSARECRVRSTTKEHELGLWFLVVDPLGEIVAPFGLDDTVDRQVADLNALPVGLREDGLVYKLGLLGTHVLAVGATGSGKGSVIWSLLNALGPAIRDRTCVVWALDPKGGMELAPGRRLFSKFVYGDPTDTLNGSTSTAYEVEFAAVLEDAVAVMRRRQSVLRGVTRLHTPSAQEPLVVIVVDEIASLTAYVVDRDAKRRIAAALALLLSQGRAVGVVVVGAVQDPRKEILTVRDLFPTRIALRLSEVDHVALVLGQGARDRGARCDQIPESLPGVGYVGIDGVAEPVRVRFTYLTDEQIADLAFRYAPAPLVSVAPPESSTPGLELVR